jgi:hypothetical protein
VGLSVLRSEGDYSGVYNPRGHHGQFPAVRIENGDPIPTLGRNPYQNGQNFADGINIHEGYSATRRGSAGCPTIAPGYADQVWHVLQPGQWYPVHIIR